MSYFKLYAPEKVQHYKNALSAVLPYMQAYRECEGKILDISFRLGQVFNFTIPSK
jgi:hypothetical protein